MDKLMDRDFLSALVLFFIGTVSLAAGGDDIMNWVFPRLATYAALGIAVILLVRVLFGAALKRVSDIISMSAEDRLVAVDVVLFLSIVLGYLLVMYGLGFWASSFVMLSMTSVLLTLDKTPRNIGLALVVPLSICIVAYVVFQHIFYVPVPDARWWPIAN